MKWRSDELRADTLIGRTFDTRYVIERKLGSGGMADVYLAEDKELGRRVALKLLDDRHASDEQFVERFRREAQSAAGLNHPSIVSIFDRGYAEGTYYIAMEYLDGRTLKELLVKNGPTPVPIAIDYARQILGALAFAHRNAIVHRDIKPHNIVVGGDGRLKVTDFGIARSGASQMTEAGSIVGTAQYLSPEQARGAPVDPRSDIYSLGVVLYEMLTGKVPFSGDTPVEIAMKHLSQVPEPPSTLRDGIPHDLDAVVMRALAKDPDQRYATAEEMDADLARVARGVAVSRETEDAMTQVLSGAGISTAQTMIQRPRTTVTPPAPPVYRQPGYYDYEEPPRGRSIWPWLIALGLIIAGGIGGWFLYTKIQDQLNSNKPVAVPDVLLLQKDLAKLKITQAGLSPQIVQGTSDTVPPGQVAKEEPSSGTKIGKGSTVTLTVSTGKPKVAVPNVVGQDSTSAVSALAAEGLQWKIRQVYSNEQSGHRDGAAAARGRLGDQGNDRPHQRLARREAGARARRDRTAVRECEGDARGPGLPGRPHRGPVRPAEGRRRRGNAVGRNRRAARREDHARRLEGAGDDPGARRDGYEPVRGRVAAHGSRARPRRSSPIRSPIRRRTASSSPPTRLPAPTRNRARS